jgi:hypothetical protein
LSIGTAIRWRLRSPLLGVIGLIQGFVEVDQETQRSLSVWMFVSELLTSSFDGFTQQWFGLVV